MKSFRLFLESKVHFTDKVPGKLNLKNSFLFPFPLWTWFHVKGCPWELFHPQKSTMFKTISVVFLILIMKKTFERLPFKKYVLLTFSHCFFMNRKINILFNLFFNCKYNRLMGFSWSLHRQKQFSEPAVLQ